jgi:Domain of unknown function (DUF3806)
VSGQAIEAPNQAELDWIEANLGIAKALRAAYLGSEESLPPPPELDQIFATWMAEWQSLPEGQRDDPNVYINAVGIAFGQTLVDQLGLAWAIVTDEHGTEVAVHGQPGDVLVFPTNLIAKRFERGETDFIAMVFDGIAAQVQELRG